MRVLTASLIFCVVAGTFSGLGCQKPGPVRTKAMKVNTEQNLNDAESTAAMMDEDNKKTGTKYK